MRLDRNAGRGKYAVINLRKLNAYQDEPKVSINETSVEEAIRVLEEKGLINYGAPGTDSEFFVIMLKDQYAADALTTYAARASVDDPEYGRDVVELANRAGPFSSWCKQPD